LEIAANVEIATPSNKKVKREEMSEEKENVPLPLLSGLFTNYGTGQIVVKNVNVYCCPK
jgi:hypothetical protein